MIKVINYQFKIPEYVNVVNTTSRSDNWSQGLSPFYLGPCDLYDGHKSVTMENAWQYSKVYYNMVDENDNPNEDYFKWAKAGWANTRANRYPAGKGSKPLYSFWDGKKLTYIEARKAVYIPLYKNAVKDTAAFKQLKELYVDCYFNQLETLYLLDFDAHNLPPKGVGETYDDLWSNPNIKVGHAYVLAQMLEDYISERNIE